MPQFSSDRKDAAAIATVESVRSVGSVIFSTSSPFPLLLIFRVEDRSGED